MEIRNATRDVVLATEAWRADRWHQRLRGLLGRDRLATGEGIYIVPCTSIHTFFMRFPIDILFISADGVVVRAFENMGAWKMTRIYPEARGVVELPAGTLAATGTFEGDTVAFS